MTAEQVRKIRKKLFLTQAEFAKILGVNKNTVCNWETNDFSPSIKMQKKIYQICQENNIEWNWD